MDDDTISEPIDYMDLITKAVVGLVLVTLAVLVLLALVSFITDRGGSLDDLPAPAIKAAVDAASEGGA